MQSKIRKDVYFNKTSFNNTAKKRLKTFSTRSRQSQRAYVLFIQGIKWFLRAISNVLSNIHDADEAPLPIISQTNESRNTLETKPRKCPSAHNRRWVITAFNWTPKPLHSPFQCLLTAAHIILPYKPMMQAAVASTPIINLHIPGHCRHPDP